MSGDLISKCVSDFNQEERFLPEAKEEGPARRTCWRIRNTMYDACLLENISFIKYLENIAFIKYHENISLKVSKTKRRAFNILFYILTLAWTLSSLTLAWLVQPPWGFSQIAKNGGAGFWGTLWGKPCATFGKKMTRSRQVTELWRHKRINLRQFC